MKTYKLQFSQTAENDLMDIYLYVKNQLLEPKIADILIRKLESEILSLSNMPQRFSLVTDQRLSRLGIRKTIVDNYIVFYLVEEKTNTVYIVRILYARRDWVSIL